MPPKTQLVVVDSSYLAWRAFHTTGMLRNADQPTGVLYGFFVTVRTLAAQLRTTYFAFCFDGGKGQREQMYPEYKKARRDRVLTPTEEEAFKQFRIQVNRLEKELLPAVGFRNVYKQVGYEADDLVARCVEDLPFDQFTVVSGDADLYQLLSKERDVTIWDPVKKVMRTETWFRETYGIAPYQWPWVKACAGCSSDGIKGVKGVGEKGALAYLTKQIDPQSAKFKLIASNLSVIQDNLRLTQLPLQGCNSLVWEEDELDHAKWEKVAKSLGFRSVPKLFDNPGFGLGVKR